MSRARSLARRYAVQAIYQWQVGGVENAVDLYFVTDKDRNRIDEDYFLWVPPDPKDELAARMLTELQYLTPDGRGLGDSPAPEL